MNKAGFERYKADVLAKAKYRPVDGAVRPYGSREGFAHWRKKSDLVYAFNHGTLDGLGLDLLQHFVGEDLRDISVYSEVRWRNGLASDVVVVLRGKTVIIEVLDTEGDTDESIKRKQAACEKMGFDFAMTEARA